MKKTTLAISVIAILAAATQAHAATDPRPELKKRWENGKTPSAKELKGVWLGRCFGSRSDQPETLGALLVAYGNTDRNGPLFEESNEVRYFIEKSDRAEKFDNFPARDFARERPWEGQESKYSFNYYGGGTYYNFEGSPYLSENSAYVSDGGYVMDGEPGWDHNDGEQSWVDDHLFEKTSVISWNIRKNGKHLIALKSRFKRTYKSVKVGGFLSSKREMKLMDTQRVTEMACYFYENLLN